MTDELDHTWRGRRRAVDHTRIRRITSGLDIEADAAADGALVPKRTRLAPAEHWRPQAAPDEAGAIEPAPEEAAAAETAPLDEVADLAGELLPQAAAQVAAPAPAEPAARGAARPPRRRRFRLPGSRAHTASWLDRLLLAIEVLAMLGLVGATFASLGLVDRMTEDLGRLGAPPATRVVGTATAAPTPTPLATPTATPAPKGTAGPAQVMLPGGRDAPAAVPTQAAPAASLAGARIIIDAIGVDAPIVEGDDWETLKRGVGHHVGSALPGEPGNVVLAAHNDVYGSIFRKLSELREGDTVRIDTRTGSYHYRVTSISIVFPTETSVMDPDAGPALTLITCYPPLVDSHRVVVTADLVE